MKNSIIGKLTCLLFFLAACSSPSKQKQKTESTPPSSSADSTKSEGSLPNGLTHEEAMIRSKQIAHVTYELWFGLEDVHSDYEGRAVVNFELRPKAHEHGKSLFLDFSGGMVKSVVVNGTTLKDITSPERYDGNRIHFQLSELQPSTNRIEISFNHLYSKNGHGLHRFKDPVDDAVYLYTDFEPFFAHTAFPCFDQPDLKAAFELTVETPPEWQVVSNTLEREVSNIDGRKSWAFPPTPLLSTYLFALIAGDYVSWKSDAEGIPLRLFARKSLKQYVDAPEWFDITRKGLDFYSVEFGYPYPYSKYDQILVPEFDAGAMENAAAITFTENYVFRTKMTRRSHENRANTILHEMAHMWFGDLVTMKWWNGLWLNESFATFMSSLAASETLPVEGMHKETAWENFFGEKEWAYWTDQLVTTHPVDLPVPDTAHAFSNFDGITYGKGASVLKQLRYYLGDDDFREGVQRYFQKYALRNTTLSEFMKMLSEASGKDLTAWQELWLMTAGVNSVRAEWTCSADANTDATNAAGAAAAPNAPQKISKFELVQSPAENSKILRPHRIQIGLYTTKGQKDHETVQLKDTISTSYAGERSAVAEALGKPCPEIVFPNVNDYDYVKVEFDHQSLKELSDHLSMIPDVLTRQMFWNSLWTMVVDGKLSPTAYADLALTQLVSEKDSQVYQEVLRNLISTHLYSAIGFMTKEQRVQYLPQMEALVFKKMRSSSPGGDAQLIWFHALIEAATTPDTITYLQKLLDGKAKISGLKIDEEVRWSLIETLARNSNALGDPIGFDQAQALISHELTLDPTEMGKKRAIAAEVQIPDPKVKSVWADRIFAAADPKAETPYNSSSLKKAMSNFFIVGQEALGAAFVERYFAMLPQVAQSPDEEYVKFYASAFYPSLCTQQVIDLTTQALTHVLPATAQKNLLINRQTQQRCLRAREAKEQIQ
jgi:aminopeptidase N